MRASSSGVSAGASGARRELAQLLAIVDVRQHASSRAARPAAMDRGLAERAIRPLEKAQLLDFLHAVDQPLARAVAAMVVLRKGRFGGVVPLEHPARVRDADHVAGVGAAHRTPRESARRRDTARACSR